VHAPAAKSRGPERLAGCGGLIGRSPPAQSRFRRDRPAKKRCRPGRHRCGRWTRPLTRWR